MRDHTYKHTHAHTQILDKCILRLFMTMGTRVYMYRAKGTRSILKTFGKFADIIIPTTTTPRTELQLNNICDVHTSAVPSPITTNNVLEMFT